MSHDLTITRDVDVPREKLFRCWTDATLMEEWFCPKPWRTRDTRLDLRPGGRMEMEMFGPDGESHAQQGVFLEIVPNERIIFTDAYQVGWTPSGKPFMTVIVTFEDLGNGRTRYTATARHWNADDRDSHEKMGFKGGWETALDQLVELAGTLCPSPSPVAPDIRAK